jgi:hypothetical protein
MTVRAAPAASCLFEGLCERGGRASPVPLRTRRSSFTRHPRPAHQDAGKAGPGRWDRDSGRDHDAHAELDNDAKHRRGGYHGPVPHAVNPPAAAPSRGRRTCRVARMCSSGSAVSRRSRCRTAHFPSRSRAVRGRLLGLGAGWSLRGGVVSAGRDLLGKEGWSGWPRRPGSMRNLTIVASRRDREVCVRRGPKAPYLRRARVLRDVSDAHATPTGDARRANLVARPGPDLLTPPRRA